MISRISGFFDRRDPIFVIRDPELLKQLTVKDFDHFEDHRPHIDDKTDELFGNSLFFMKGEKWRDMRANLSPAFTGSKMRQMFELITEIADQFVEYLSAENEKGHRNNWEMKDLFSMYANDVIASTAFGIKINSLEDRDNEFMAAGKKFRDISDPKALIKLLLITSWPRLSKALGYTFIEKSVANFFRPMILDTMVEREKRNIFRPDMINILMQVRKENLQQTNAEQQLDDSVLFNGESTKKRVVKRQWTDNELVAQCLLFFSAGFGTISDLLSFGTYELATHPELQDRLYSEILDVHQSLDGKPLSYEALQGMKYLDQVVSEVLRKWPPAPLIDRICVKEHVIEVDGKRIDFEKGVGFYLNIYGFQRDPKYFPNPEQFDPDRFSDENKHNIVPGTYIPFGMGPRHCIGNIESCSLASGYSECYVVVLNVYNILIAGNRFALMEAKALLYHLLLNFKLEPNEKTDIPLKLQNSYVSINALNGIHLDFIRRNKQ